MKGKTIVLAESLDDVVVITPRTLDRARGVVAREVLAAKGIAGQPGHRDLWDAIAPCFATTPAAPSHRREVGCSCGWWIVDDSGDDGEDFNAEIEYHAAYCNTSEPTVSSNGDES